jgi:acyl-CoA hydrolase
MAEMALPNHANALTATLGGKVMPLMDIAGAISAPPHCRSLLVTASADNLDFVHPIELSQLILPRAFVTRTFNNSLKKEK